MHVGGPSARPARRHPTKPSLSVVKALDIGEHAKKPVAGAHPPSLFCRFVGHGMVIRRWGASPRHSPIDLTSSTPRVPM